MLHGWWGGELHTQRVQRGKLTVLVAAKHMPSTLPSSPAKLSVTLAPSCGSSGAAAASRGWHMSFVRRSWEAGTGFAIHSRSWLMVTQNTSFLPRVKSATQQHDHVSWWPIW